MNEVATQLKVRVSPRARKPGIGGRHGDAWKVRVAEPPENGRANEAVLRLLAETLDVPRGRVALVSGKGSQDKTILLMGIDETRVEQLLESAGAKT